MSMQVQIEGCMMATPIRVSMTYAEAINIQHALEHLIPKDGNYPTTNKLLELLKSVTKDPYFD